MPLSNIVLYTGEREFKSWTKSLGYPESFFGSLPHFFEQIPGYYLKLIGTLPFKSFNSESESVFYTQLLSKYNKEGPLGLYFGFTYLLTYSLHGAESFLSS